MIDTTLMLWFLVTADLTVTTEKLVELFPPASDYDLGALLDLARAKVAEIDRNYHSPSQRTEAYLDLYATGHPCPSWRQIIEVLRGINLHHQADVVENTYVQGITCTKFNTANTVISTFSHTFFQELINSIHACQLLADTIKID